MKGIASWTIVGSLFLLVVGCGGGGGGSSSTGTTGTGTSSGTYHSFQVTAYQGSSAGQMISTRDLVAGDVVQLEVTARDANENLVVLPASTWTTNAPKSVVSLTSSGVLTAQASSGITNYSISVNYGGASYSAVLIVGTLQDLVTGSVQNSGVAIEDAIVDFYNASGSQVGTAYTARDGSFRASVPSTAVRFTLDLSLADPGAVTYYPQFVYGASTFLNGTSCLAPLPQISSTAPTALPNTVLPYLRSAGPPPPPTGCLG